MVARTCISTLSAALLLVFIAGCPATDDIGTVVPVTGRVTIDDRPLESGTVTFYASEAKGNKSKAGVSGIVKSGEYTLTSGTATANKTGAPPGFYKVTISTIAAMTGTGTEVPKDKVGVELGKVGTPTMQPIADKYTKVDSTPLEVEVKTGGSFDLKASSK